MKITVISSSLPISRITVFSINVLKDERVVVVAEQRPTCTDEEAFSWMNNVVPAVESIHGLNLYGIVLVHHNRLPRVSFICTRTAQGLFTTTDYLGSVSYQALLTTTDYLGSVSYQALLTTTDYLGSQLKPCSPQPTT